MFAKICLHRVKKLYILWKFKEDQAVHQSGIMKTLADTCLKIILKDQDCKQSLKSTTGELQQAHNQSPTDRQ